MARLILVHIALLLLLLHTSIQTDFKSNHHEDFKEKVIALKNALKTFPSTRMLKIDKYIRCMSNYWNRDAVTGALTRKKTDSYYMV
ncbi:unnamed protein product [Schistosoma bovis]|nr:unnamed protein product [Schistosoma bovis]